MRKLMIVSAVLFCSISLTACTVPNNLENAFNEQTDGFGNAISEKFDEFGDEIGERIDEKVSETVDNAKDEAKERVEESLSNGLTEMTDEITDGIGIQFDKLVEYSPGAWFEDVDEVAYESQGIKMNTFWELDEEAGTLEIKEDVCEATVPDGAVVTVTFFEKMPDNVNIYVGNENTGELVQISAMINPLTGKSTYSFIVEFDEQGMKEYSVRSEFEESTQLTIKLIFTKE